MKFGLGIPNCREGRGIPAGFSGPREIVQLSCMAERLDFDCLWGGRPSERLHEEMLYVLGPYDHLDLTSFDLSLAACLE